VPPGQRTSNSAKAALYARRWISSDSTITPSQSKIKASIEVGTAAARIEERWVAIAEETPAKRGAVRAQLLQKMGLKAKVRVRSGHCD
jgi:hypothetical protein